MISAASPVTAAIPEELKRPLSSFIVWAVVGVLLAWSYQGAEINFPGLWRDVGNLGDLSAEFFPPNLSQWAYYMQEMIITVQIAVWGTFLSVILAVPFGLMSANNVAPAWIVFPMRRLMDAFRAINEMVFALLFVAAVGLGPFAGVLALWVHTTGTLAKLFSEAIEAINPNTVEGIRATGAPKLAEIRFGIFPQVAPLWVSYTLYRFESNVRSATVLGIIGAGGIGQSLYETIRSFAYPEACTILIIIIISVSIIDIASTRMRSFCT
jgi:phosphonate transport system permease protein